MAVSVPALDAHTLLGFGACTTVVVEYLRLALRPVGQVHTVVDVHSNKIHLALGKSQRIVQLDVVVLNAVFPQQGDQLTGQFTFDRGIQDQTVVEQVAQQADFFRLFVPGAISTLLLSCTMPI